MLILAYLTLIAAVWWMSGARRPWISSLGPAQQKAVRVALACVAALLGAAGLLLIWSADTSVAGVVGASLLAGSALYVAGIVAWRGQFPYVIRLMGCFLVTAPLAVPSTLTLALPLAALLVVSLTPVSAASASPRLLTRHSS